MLETIKVILISSSLASMAFQWAQRQMEKVMIQEIQNAR
jgi:hypothetical protein